MSGYLLGFSLMSLGLISVVFGILTKEFIFRSKSSSAEKSDHRLNRQRVRPINFLTGVLFFIMGLGCILVNTKTIRYALVIASILIFLLLQFNLNKKAKQSSHRI
jgi:L-asparagine transporter-like permease